MKHYKDDLNNVYAYEEDGSQDDLIGNKTKMTSQEIDAHINPTVTDDQKRDNISRAIQSMLDDKAIELRYDNIMSMRSWCGWDNPFAIECEIVCSWAASCWVVAGQIEQDVIDGIRTIPTVEEALLEMPIL